MAVLLNLDSIPPGAAVLPRIVGSAVEGGTSLSGITTASDATGGGLIAVDYTDIVLGNSNQTNMRYFNRIAVKLSGGIQVAIVPLLVDYLQPILPSDVPNESGGLFTFSDGSHFSDSSLFADEHAVAGFVIGAQSVGSATITVSVLGGTGVLHGGEWFGLVHSTKGQRAYCVTDIDSQTTDAFGDNIYTVGIRPPLRDAIADGAPVTWWRPLCLMRLAPGSNPDISVRPYWTASPSLKFIEAF